MSITEQPAKGTKGFILFDHINAKYFFRVYHSEDKRQFTDYDFGFTDMEVEITDNHVAFYSDGRLDYNSQALGKGPWTMKPTTEPPSGSPSSLLQSPSPSGPGSSEPSLTDD